ncbi:hypothetical protein Q5752_003614 [Cryptotrichosporon argae]
MGTKQIRAHLSRRSAGVFDTSYAAAYRLGATAPFGYITWIGFGAEVGDSSTTVLQFKWTAGATASDITTVRYTYYYGIEADNNMSAGYGVTNGWTSSDGTDIDDYSYETSVWNTAANAPYQVTSTWYNPTGSATTSVAIKYWYNSAAANGQIIYAASLDGANAAATSGTLYVADDEFEMFLVDSLL